MGAEKKPDLPVTPETPTYQTDPRFGQGIDQLFGLGGDLTSFQNLPPELMETMQTSPQLTSLYIEGLRAQLEPLFAEERQQSINRLAAQGQLSGSTLPSTLADIEKRKQEQYITQTSQFGISDINRAMTNRVGLFGTGLQTLSGATGMAGTSQEMQNQFALQNYQNLLAKQQADAARIMWGYDPKGGWTGAIQGGLSGAMAGSAAGPYGMIGGAVIGGTAGYFAPASQNTGSQLGLMGALYGGRGISSGLKTGSSGGTGNLAGSMGQLYSMQDFNRAFA